MEDLRDIKINFYYKLNDIYVSLSFSGLYNLENYTVEKDIKLGEKFTNDVKNHYKAMLDDKIQDIKIKRISKKEYDENSDDDEPNIIVEYIKDDELSKLIRNIAK